MFKVLTDVLCNCTRRRRKSSMRSICSSRNWSWCIGWGRMQYRSFIASRSLTNWSAHFGIFSSSNSRSSCGFIVAAVWGDVRFVKPNGSSICQGMLSSLNIRSILSEVNFCSILIHFWKKNGWVRTFTALGKLFGYESVDLMSCSNDRISSMRWANSCSSRLISSMSCKSFSIVNWTRPRINSSRMLSQAQARFAGDWKISFTQWWLSRAQLRICVKKYSGLSGRLVCRDPIKWYSNRTLNGFTSNSIGVLIGGQIIEGANLTYMKRS